MRILVTGGAGFIGSHTVDLLLEKGHRVRVLDNLAPPVHRDGRKPDYLPDVVDFRLGDVRNRNDMVSALKGIDVVFHFAAYQDYLTDFSTFASVNDVGTALLYEIIVNQHLPVQKVIVASSQAVYGEGKYQCEEHGVQYPLPRTLDQLEQGNWEVQCDTCGQPMKPQRLDESHVSPHNQYAVSKYCQELYALTLGRKHGIPTVAMRYSITQGPRQSFFNAYSGILRSFTIRLLQNMPPLIYEDGGQLRDYVYVGDVVRANLLVMENEAANYRAFNVGGRKPVTVLEYARALLKITGKNIFPEVPGQFRHGDSRHTFSDSTSIEELGWKTTAHLEQIIHEYVDWAQSQPEVPYQSYTTASRVMKQTEVVRTVK